MTDTETRVRAKHTKNKPRTSRGPLHDILTDKLPDLVDKKSQVLNLHQLADQLHMTYQGVYKWFKPGRPNRLPLDKVDKLLNLSALQITGDLDFTPMTRDDIWKFISS